MPRATPPSSCSTCSAKDICSTETQRDTERDTERHRETQRDPEEGNRSQSGYASSEYFIIHAIGFRASQPCVKCDITSLPSELADSQARGRTGKPPRGVLRINTASQRC